MTDAIKSFSPIRMTAATESAAVEQALQIVGATRENVSVEVLTNDAKGVTVRVSQRKEGEETAPVAAPVTSSTRSSEVAPETPQIYMSSNAPGTEVSDAMEARIPVETHAATTEAGVEEVKAVENLQDVLPTMPEDLPANEPVSHVEKAQAETAPVEADAATQERARAMAQEILDRMGMDAQSKLMPAPTSSGNSDVPRIYLQIDGEDVGILIGKHGQTLQSFQYLLNVTLNNASEEDAPRFRVSVDAGGYRARRGDSLQQMALDAASRAKRDNRSVRLEPMPAHERRLVHMALQNDGTISTSSEGREPLRHVIVIPAGALATSARPLATRPSTGSGSGGGRPNGSFGGRDNNRDYGGSRGSNGRGGGYRGAR